MKSIVISAPAKVNLFLEVLNKRKDSYHNILTVFERISLSDKIKITKLPNTRGIVIRSDKFITKDPKDNLVYKAAKLILTRRKVSAGVGIELKKNIPIAAGLGGGSSDAAAVLTGINRLFNLNIGKTPLMKLGARLGADVPFFIFDSPFVIGRSRGEKLTATDSNARFWHLLIYPGFRVATKAIYEAFDSSKRLTPRQSSGSSPAKSRAERGELLPKDLTKPYSDDKITLPFDDYLDFGTAESMLHNSLEEPVKFKYRMISGIIERLAHILDKRAIISGSGPSLFCLYETEKEVVAAKRRLLSKVPERERRLWQVFVARTA